MNAGHRPFFSPLRVYSLPNPYSASYLGLLSFFDYVPLLPITLGVAHNQKTVAQAIENRCKYLGIIKKQL
jgi:hypothetical protein